MTRKPIGLTAPYRPKTVLAPNAPWPAHDEPKPKAKAKPQPKVKKTPPPKDPSKIKRTDAKFDEWLNKVEVIKC